MTPSTLAIHRVRAPALNSLASPDFGRSPFAQILTNSLILRTCYAEIDG